MATRERPIDRGAARARFLIPEIGREIRAARQAAGLSLRVAAAAVGLDHTTFGRIERGLHGSVTLVDLALACSAVGLQLAVRAYPDGDPVRDAAHQRLLERFRQRLPPLAPWRTEVPLPIAGDRRAVDGQTTIGGEFIAVEAETHLTDIQALERRLLLKQRDAGYRVMILAVSDTAHNRRVLDAHRVSLQAAFPLDSRAVLRALQRGAAPAASGIVVV